MDKTVMEIHKEIRHRILKAVSIHLPPTHVGILDDYQTRFTVRELQLFKTRLDSMPAEDFPDLMIKLGNAATDRFCCFLMLAVTEPNCPYFPSSPSQIYEEQYQADFLENVQGDQTDDTGLDAIEEGTYDDKIDNGEHPTELSQDEAGVRYQGSVSLRERIFGGKGVPQEIYIMLIEELFRAMYLPGSVIPTYYADSDGHACFADVELCLEKSRLFHEIDRNLYDRYTNEYWSKNIWQIQCGDVSDTVGWIHNIPPENYLAIRFVKLAFSTMDSYLARDFYYLYEFKLNLLENLERYETEIRNATRDLNDIWFWKFETISGMRLDELVLDFTDAFSADGHFLGLHSAMYFKRFAYKAPKLTIHAPTTELEELIRGVFVAVNQ